MTASLMCMVGPVARTMLLRKVVCSKVGVKVTRQMPSTSGHAMSFSDTDPLPYCVGEQDLK